MSEAARAVIANKSKSFALASRLLPRETGDEVAVLYAYCRRADDEVDLAPPREQAERVDRLYAELASIYAGEPQSEPLLAEFQALVERRQIPEEYPRALLDGMRSDLGPVRLATLDELLVYSYRVAGVVGLMLCHVFGLSDRNALKNATDLGIAMQLTNICRDVREDLARGRVYVPADVLRASGAVGVGDFDSALVARAVERLLAIADGYYRSGDGAFTPCPCVPRWPCARRGSYTLPSVKSSRGATSTRSAAVPSCPAGGSLRSWGEPCSKSSARACVLVCSGARAPCLRPRPCRWTRSCARRSVSVR